MSRKKKETTGKISYIFTRETMGMTLLLFCGIVFIMLLTGSAVFAGIGKAVCTFMYGTFGYGSWLIVALLAYLGVWLVFEKKIKIAFVKALMISLTVLSLFLLIHAATSNSVAMDGYGSYISGCYTRAADGWSGYTFGGVISAILVYPVAKLTTFIGAYVIYSVLTLAFGYLTFFVYRRAVKSRGNDVSETETEEYGSDGDGNQSYGQYVAYGQQSEPYVPTPAGAEPAPYRPQPEQVDTANNEITDNVQESKRNLGRKILFENGEFAAESYRRNMIFNEDSYFNHPVTNNESDYLSGFSVSDKKSAPSPDKSYSEAYRDEILSRPASYTPTNYVYGDKPVEELTDTDHKEGITYSNLNEPARDGGYQTDNYGYPTYSSSEEGASPKFSEPKPSETEPLRASDIYRESVQDERFDDVTQSAPETGEKKDDDSRSPNIFRIFGGESPRTDVRGDAQTPRTESRRPIEDAGDGETARNSNSVEPERSSEDERGRNQFGERRERSNADIFDYDDDGDGEDEDIFSARGAVGDKLPPLRESGRDVGRDIGRESARGPVGFSDSVPDVGSAIPPIRRAEEPIKRTVEPAGESKKPEEKEKPKHVWKKYVRPPIDLLDDYPENNNVNTSEIEDSKRIIVETLDKFKIACEVANVTIGPAITRYDVVIEDKTNIKRSLNYRDAIAMELRKENVTAYLNYSKGALSIEVPNNCRTTVGLKGMIASSKFLNSKSNSLTFALGKSIDGEVICPDITKMPHLLVAGTTGSGKSICLSSLLISLLYKYGPEELRLILVDPKQVEFISYDKLPHLMINEILHEVNTAIKALKWATDEMERRYTLFKDMTESGIATKNLEEYNNHLPQGEEKLPKILIVLDEFGDLMLQAKKEIENRIIKLVQKARACGIHLILATQRPSVDCITGLIKSNLPTRIGFKVNSFDDSRTIFDIGGAEKLLGKGDMYFRSAESPDLMRIQGCFVDTHEVQKVTDYIKANNETYFDQSVSDYINTVEKPEETAASMGGEGVSADEGENKIDDTFIKALKFCVNSNQASVSMIQRRFPVGYIKACRIIDWMENMNYITQSEGSKPRKVLLSKEEFINTYGDIDD